MQQAQTALETMITAITHLDERRRVYFLAHASVYMAERLLRRLGAAHSPTVTASQFAAALDARDVLPRTPDRPLLMNELMPALESCSAFLDRMWHRLSGTRALDPELEQLRNVVGQKLEELEAFMVHCR